MSENGEGSAPIQPPSHVRQPPGSEPVETTVPRRTPLKRIALGAVIIFVAGLLTGFLPEFFKARKAQAESQAYRARIQQLELRQAFADMRDTAAMLYVELSRKNFGLAAGHAGRFFTQVEELWKRTSDPGIRGRLESLRNRRAAVSAAIANADPAALAAMGQVMEEVHSLTPAGMQ